MQISVTTDYAIRTIIYLGTNLEKKSSTQISEEVKIPRAYIEKVLAKLKREGYICAEKGKKGGYSLTKGLNEITIGQILKSMDPEIKISKCLEENYECSLNAIELCKVKKYYCKIQRVFEEIIFNITMQEILEEKYDFSSFFEK